MGCWNATLTMSPPAAASRHRDRAHPRTDTDRRRVDGRDVEPGSEPPSGGSVACRLYRLEHRFAGQPAERWVRDALLSVGRTDAIGGDHG
jgi:hypothetical protein